jgi:hypothetical protein
MDDTDRDQHRRQADKKTSDRAIHHFRITFPKGWTEVFIQSRTSDFKQPPRKV